jgi:hypothetical protein
MNSKVANKPILTNKGLDARKVSAGEGFALYWIDAGANHSKFYEGLMLENDDGTWSVTFRWGALTDSGFTGRIDGAKWDGKFAHLGKSQAQAALQKKYRAKTGKGYIDVWGSRHVSPNGKKLPRGQYPIGLTRNPAFGWGVQDAAFCIPALRHIRFNLEEAQGFLNRMQFGDASDALNDAASLAARELASADSSMAKKIKDNIAHMQGRADALLGGEIDTGAIKNWKTALSRLMSYLDGQLSTCNQKRAAFETDPKEIGKIEGPAQMDSDEGYMRDFDQRWFSEVIDEAKSPGKPWDGHGPAPAVQVVKMAARVIASTQDPVRVDRVARRWIASQKSD